MPPEVVGELRARNWKSYCLRRTSTIIVCKQQFSILKKAEIKQAYFKKQKQQQPQEKHLNAPKSPVSLFIEIELLILLCFPLICHFM
jgi:hypothetical protein